VYEPLANGWETSYFSSFIIRKSFSPFFSMDY